MATTTPTVRKVTQEQIDAADRWIDESANKVFYLVESQSEPGTYYKVQWNAEYHVLQCLPHNGRPCPAAESGKHCWHLDAALAAEVQFKDFKRNERIAAARIAQESIEAGKQYQAEMAEQNLYTAQINLK